VFLQAQYIDDFHWVARKYVTSGGLPFDLFTSIPVSFVEVSVKMACDAVGGSAGNESAGETDSESFELRFIRMIKPLRWFKLARMLKVSLFRNLPDTA